MLYMASYTFPTVASGPILERKSLKPREGLSLAQGHMASEGQSPDVFAARDVALFTGYTAAPCNWLVLCR